MSDDSLPSIPDTENPETPSVRTLNFKFPGTQARTGRKKPHHYTDSDDITLLKEILALKVPRKGSVKKWKQVFLAAQIPVKDYKALQARFNVLLSSFKSDEQLSFRGSGIEEEYDEKRQLMTDICSQLEDWTIEPSTEKKNDETVKRAREIREAAASGMSSDNVESPSNEEDPPKKRMRIRPSRNDFMDVLRINEENEREHKNAQVEIERKRLDLANREMKLKEEDAVHRREMERRQADLHEKQIETERQRLEADNRKFTMLLELLNGKFQQK